MMNKNIVAFSFITLLTGIAGTYFAPQVLADYLIDRSGTIMMVDPMVLGDEDVEVKDVEKVEPAETSKRESDNSVNEQKREQLKKQEEIKKETIKTEREQVREVAKQALERKIKLNESKNKNIKNEYEISATSGELKVKQKTKTSAGQETERELELQEKETLHIDQEDGESVDIDVKSPGEIEITKDTFKGRTRLPLSVNSDNQLMVTRPDGSTKVVSVLPDEAISKMIEKGTLVSSDNIELTTDESGDPVYQVKQEVSKKILGLFAMNFEEETTVSATDSNVVARVSTETSPWRRLLERLAR